MAQTQTQFHLKHWLDAALAGASIEEVRDDDGVLVGWWAENPECPGASAFGATSDEAGDELRRVLTGWVELGRELGHRLPALPGNVAAATARAAGYTRPHIANSSAS